MKKSENTNYHPNILITGGSGFLGKRIVDEFLMQGSPVIPGSISIFDIKKYKGNSSVKYIKGDIRNFEEISKACHGMDILIHTAAIVDWGTRPQQEIYDVNFTGTKNVVQACKENGVKWLIYTSSLDAIYTGKTLVDIDEEIAYPEKFPNLYCKTKMLGEKAVMAANNGSLKTCILRPSDIYGEEDPYHIDSLVNMARSGFYVRLGNGKTKSQHVYVGNVAYAHVLAAKALIDDNKDIAGKVYFVTDGSGHNFFKFFDQIIIGAGYKIWPKNFWIPRKIAYAMGCISEFIAVLARPVKKYYPTFSRFAVIYTCTDFTFKTDKAKQDFGFEPKYSEEVALQNTINYYKEQRKRNELK